MSFIRPEWFVALPLWLLLVVWVWKRRASSASWAKVIDPLLLPHLLVGKSAQHSRAPLIIALLLGCLMILALAGPVWEKRSQPVFKQQSALVIALDLSRSMNAADIKPSRLERARLKLVDLLKARREGQTALIAYAAKPFTVAPLTDDFDTILSLLPSLTTDIMPAQGSRADLALAKAIELLDNAGLTRGDILFVTDGINDSSYRSMLDRHMPGFRLSVLAVGSEDGAPVQDASGGFVKDDSGAIVLARTDFDRLQQLARQKDGVMQTMQLDDSDIERIEALIESGLARQDQQQTDINADQWREEGPWLFVLILPLAALAFRRGFILTLLLGVMIAPLPRSAEAAPDWWSQLWNNNNQLGQQALEAGDAAQAAELFDRPDWSAAANYKAGQYDKALESLQQLEPSDQLVNADTWYNKANAQAQLGQLEDALASYQQALQLDPNHDDAAYNQKVVEEALKEQQQQQQAGENSDQQDASQDDQQQSSEQNKDSQQSPSDDQQQSDQAQQDSQDGQSGEQSEPDSSQQSTQPSSPQDGQNNDQQPEPNNSQAEQSNESEGDSNPDQQMAQPKSDEEPEQPEQQAASPSEQQQAQPSELDPEQRLSEQAAQQWLRRIPDDPGGLLRNKFRYQYNYQRSTEREQEPW